MKQPLSPRRAALQRLRFEREMGAETLPRAKRTKAHFEPPADPDPFAKKLPPAAETSSASPVNQAAASSSPPLRGASPQTVVAASENNSPVEDRERRLAALRARALACTNCPLHKTRTKVVFGEGLQTARLAFVGEAPGADEDRSGRPFVGKAGQLLDRIIAAMKLSREQTYICNVLKCRPPNNRPPESSEVTACLPFLEEQLRLVAPEVIVTLGAPATKALLRPTLAISQLRGHWHEWEGIPVMPTFHPSYVLRKYTSEVRTLVWNDMKQVMKRLGIS